MTDSPGDARTAIITGAARGIGAATARRLAAAGWNVSLVDVCADDENLGYSLATREQLDAVRADCGERAISIVADVRDHDVLDDAVAETVSNFGALHAAVAAAGAITGGPPLWETTDASWWSMIGINLNGVFHLARAAVPAMLTQTAPRHGRFIAIGSSASRVGLPQLAAYTASKHGVAGLIKGLAADLADTGITANAVSPGATDTDMLDATAAIYDVETAAAFAEHARTQRLITPDEIAATVEWLCTEAPSALTGANLPVDGAFSG